MTIRRAKSKEYKIIAGFQQKMAMETENFELNTNTILQGVKAVFDEAAKGQYYVVETEGKVVAALLTTYEWSDWRNSTILWIQSVYVLPQFRTKGIYTNMYNYLKEIVKTSSKYSGIRLYVDKTNDIAQKVYKNLGMSNKHYELFEQM